MCKKWTILKLLRVFAFKKKLLNCGTLWPTKDDRRGHSYTRQAKYTYWGSSRIIRKVRGVSWCRCLSSRCSNPIVLCKNTRMGEGLEMSTPQWQRWRWSMLEECAKIDESVALFSRDLDNLDSWEIPDVAIRAVLCNYISIGTLHHFCKRWPCTPIAMCRAIPMSLEHETFEWSQRLPLGSISSFNKLKK